MQPATSKGLFSFRFSSRTFWRMVQQQGGGWRADRGVCVSSHRGLGHAHIRRLFMHRGFPPSHFLHPLHPGLLSLALAELSLMPSWRNGGFPCGWADGTLPALAWGALQRVLMRSWCSLSTTSSLGTTPLPTLALSFFSFLPLTFVWSVLHPIFTFPSQTVVEKRWMREDLNKYAREKMCSSSKRAKIVWKETGFLIDAQRTNTIS